MDKVVHLRISCTSKATICFNSVHFQPLKFEFIDTVLQIVLKLQIHIRGDPKEKQHSLSQIRREHPVE